MDEVELLVLPSRQSPRLLVPADNPLAAARAMLRFSAALSGPDTVKRVGVSTLLRGRVRTAFPDRIVVAERAGSLREHLGDVLGEPVDFSLGLGTARANRKPVLQVFDRRGRSLAFVKFGGTPATDALVEAEAASLQRLGGAGLPERLEVPRLLHVGRWGGSSLVVMTALHTVLWQRPSRQFDLPLDEMALLHGAFGDGSRPLAEMPLWDTMVAAQSSLAPSSVRDRLEEALDLLRTGSADRPLAMGAWHGDWTPWNMSRRRGQLQLWDWERFETGVPLGLDRCHYAVNAVCRRDGVSLDSVRRGLDLARVERVAPEESRLVETAYLAAITSRYLVGAESELGDVIADRSLVMLEALCDWVGPQGGAVRG